MQQIGFFEARSLNQEIKQAPPLSKQENVIQEFEVTTPPQKLDIIDVSELMRGLEDDDEMKVEENVDNGGNDKENSVPLVKKEDSENVEFFKTTRLGFSKAAEPLSDIDVSSFRRPDMNSSTLFDPNLLAVFEEAVNQHIRLIQEERKNREETDGYTIIVHDRYREEETENGIENVDDPEEVGEPPYKSQRIEDNDQDENPLLCFEEKCPPGGESSVVLYTTTLRGIRKTFEDCSSVRFLLESFRVIFFERDVSMHVEYREEMRRIMDNNTIIPPRLFIKGRYIGGAAEVLGLHEQGKLKTLFDGIPLDRSDGPCEGCSGVRFMMCYKCSGSNKVVGDDGLSIKCQDCNENGLIICPFCC